MIAIVGPTGSGKTDLAVWLARRTGGIIVSADSRQIYRGLDIGTGKPTQVQRKRVRHFGIDLVSPRQRYSVKRFQKLTYRLVALHQRRHPSEPVYLVGGTMLYIDAVLKGLDFAVVPADPVLRHKLQRAAPAHLLALLARLDPTTATQIDRHNPRRLVRALEVVIQTGESFYQRRAAHPPAWHVLKLGTRLPVATLQRRQRARTLRMLRRGWVREAERARERFGAAAPGLSSLGYQEVLQYADGRLTRAAIIEHIASATWQYTRRQLSWWRRDPAITWLSPTNTKKALQLVERFLHEP